MKPHGLKGEVTISLDPSGPEDFGSPESIFIEQDNRLIPYFIESISLKGDKAFVKFEDVSTQENAQSISKCSLYLPKSARPKSGRGDFYNDEIINFEVYDSEVGLLGKIVEIIQAGPNKLLSLDYKEKEILIPVNSPFITGINKSKKKISVTLPEGFLDI